MRAEISYLLMSEYTSQEMRELSLMEAMYWRKLWVALAKAEKKLGLPITSEQISSLESCIDEIDFEYINEKIMGGYSVVMAHLMAFQAQANIDQDIVGLNTSENFVIENGRIMSTHDGLRLVRGRLLGLMQFIADFADAYKDIPARTFYSDYANSEFMTIGKKATLWLQDFLMVLNAINGLISRMTLVGCRGELGTGENLLKLFGGNTTSCDMIDRYLAEEIGIGCAYGDTKVYSVSGRSYPWLYDLQIINTLSMLDASITAMFRDILVLQEEMDIEIGVDSNVFKVCTRKINALSVDAWDDVARQYAVERLATDTANEREYKDMQALALADLMLGHAIHVFDGLELNRGLMTLEQDFDVSIGRCVEQMKDFLNKAIYPLLTAECKNIRK